MANFVLAKAGLKPTDVSFIGVGAAAGAVSALRAGQIDAIANLDPSIERRDPPESPAEALAAFPQGLTTAEVAEVMRPSGVPGDLEGTRAALVELEAAGGAAREALGDDALWLAA